MFVIELHVLYGIEPFKHFPCIFSGLRLADWSRLCWQGTLNQEKGQEGGFITCCSSLHKVDRWKHSSGSPCKEVFLQTQAGNRDLVENTEATRTIYCKCEVCNISDTEKRRSIQCDCCLWKCFHDAFVSENRATTSQSLWWCSILLTKCNIVWQQIHISVSYFCVYSLQFTWTSS